MYGPPPSGLQWSSRARLWLALLSCLTIAACTAATRTAPVTQQTLANVIDVAAFSLHEAGATLPDGWQPWIVLPSKPLTDYALVEDDEKVVVRAEAHSAASGLFRKLDVDPAHFPIVRWSWRVQSHLDAADPREAGSEDAPARLLIAFDGDLANIDPFERINLTLAKALSGQEIPYATLMYIWSDKLPVGALVPNPHTTRIQMIVVDGAAPGSWVKLERNLAEDFQRAFGEAPGPVESIGLMTDSDNTAGTAVTFYGDITLHSAPTVQNRGT